MSELKLPHLNITVEKTLSTQTYEVIDFEGELDKYGLEKVKEQLEGLIESFKGVSLVFNFSKLDFINSESIGFLLTIHYRLTKKNKKLVLVGAPAQVKDVLDVIGMFKLIAYYDSVAVFEQSLRKN